MTTSQRVPSLGLGHASTPGLTIPQIGFGVWEVPDTDVDAAFGRALDVGYRHIDTAEMYGNEAVVGAAIAASGIPRDAVYLTTKIWSDKPDGASFRRAAEACLQRLRQPYIDLLLVHWPSPRLELEGVLRAQARLRDEGLARAAGVANFPLGLLRRAVDAAIVPIACLQVEHHVYLSQQRLLEYCWPRGIALTSYTPLAKGAVLRDAAIAAIAAKHGATPAQVALAYLLAMPGVAAIPKAASAARQAENLGALDLVLDAADRAALAALPKGRRLVDPGSAPDWEA